MQVRPALGIAGAPDGADDLALRHDVADAERRDGGKMRVARDDAFTVIDPDLLKDVAQFTGTYLHLDRVHDRTSAGRHAGDLL